MCQNCLFLRKEQHCKFMKKKIILAFACAVTILAISVGAYWYYHPTHFSYNDRFIIGSTSDDIIERYGEFSKEWLNDNGEINRAAYLIRDNTSDVIMNDDGSLWYEINFEGGVAVEVRLQEGWYGG